MRCSAEKCRTRRHLLYVVPFVDTLSLLTASKGVQEIRLLVIPTMPAHENFADGRGGMAARLILQGNEWTVGIRLSRAACLQRVSASASLG